MITEILSNPVLADRLTEVRRALGNAGYSEDWLDLLEEASARLAVWDVPIEQIAEVRRKQAETKRESAPLRRKRVHP